MPKDSSYPLAAEATQHKRPPAPVSPSLPDVGVTLMMHKTNAIVGAACRQGGGAISRGS